MMGRLCLLYHLLLGESLFLNYLLMTYPVRMGTELGFNFKQGMLALKQKSIPIIHGKNCFSTPPEMIIQCCLPKESLMLLLVFSFS